jgi:hypothetical protein
MPRHDRLLIAIMAPEHASGCHSASPRLPWRQLIAALQPLLLQAVIVRHSANHDPCDSLSALHQSLVENLGSAGVTVSEHFCEPGGCSLQWQLSLVSDHASQHDTALLVPWSAYRNGLDVNCATTGCLEQAVRALFSFSEDSARCSGALRALSLPFAAASCLDAVAGTNVSDFVLNPSPALSAYDISLVPFDALRTALRTISADAM